MGCEWEWMTISIVTVQSSFSLTMTSLKCQNTKCNSEWHKMIRDKFCYILIIYTIWIFVLSLNSLAIFVFSENFKSSFEKKVMDLCHEIGVLGLWWWWNDDSFISICTFIYVHPIDIQCEPEPTGSLKSIAWKYMALRQCR